MDSVMHNALRRREELQRELRDVERFLALYDRFKGEPPQQTLPGLQDDLPQEQQGVESGTSADQGDAPASITDKALLRLNRLQMRPHITTILEEASRPLTRGHLLRKLEQRGVLVGGTYDKSKNMGTIMWRLRNDFVNLPGLGYWPRHLRYEPAGYDPGGGSNDVVEPDLVEPQS